MFFIIPFTLYIQAQQFTTIQEQIFVNSDSIQPFLLNWELLVPHLIQYYMIPEQKIYLMLIILQLDINGFKKI